MTLKAKPINRPAWTPLPEEGCHGVEAKGLIKLDHLSLTMLRFDHNATIREHPADHNIDVICLVGQGFTSVDGEVTAIIADERVHWPAGKLHRLWTKDSEMVTLMVEHIRPFSANKPTWEDVDSSMISAFKYDPEAQTLDVIFHRTGQYRYFDVPLDVVQGLREASSKGSYMRYAIIDMYSHEKKR